VVTVTRIDRLARSTFDLFGIVKRIVDAKAQFRSLAVPWADTGTSTGGLMLAVLGGLPDVERDLIRTRTTEGRNRAKLRGKHMGRPASLTPEQQKEATRRRAQGATLQELAHSNNVGISTIRRAMLLVVNNSDIWYFNLRSAEGGGRVKRRLPPTNEQFTVAAVGSSIAKTSHTLSQEQ
jgi:DNA invertase Pin-like site-specific DNA recombinase